MKLSRQQSIMVKGIVDERLLYNGKHQNTSGYTCNGENVSCPGEVVHNYVVESCMTLTDTDHLLSKLHLLIMHSGNVAPLIF